MTTTLSYWEKSQIESAPDFTIIGAGIVGLSTAISIKDKQPNASVVVFERGRLPYGASTKNAGFSCFGSVSELIEDISNMGLERTLDIVEMRLKGLEFLKKRCGLNNIDFMPSGGVEIFRKEDTALKTECLDQLTNINKVLKERFILNDCFKTIENDVLPHFDPETIVNSHEGVLHPVKMMETLVKIAIEKDVKIYYGFNIQSIDTINNILCTEEKLEIKYKHLVVCTNGLTRQLLPDIEVVSARNQVLITQPLHLNLPFAGYHLDRGYIYFRRVGDRLLLGGGRNIDQQTETTSEFGTTHRIQSYLINILEHICPDASQSIDMWWSGILGIGPDKRPIVSNIGNNITVGVRLGGMGVAIGSHLGHLLSELVLSKNL